MIRWPGVAGAALIALLAGCTPNPRNEIPAIVAAAMREAVEQAPGKPLCVERIIGRWQTAREVMRLDTPAPPGFEDLRAERGFHGGGGIKGAAVGGVAVRSGQECFDLRGPVIAGDRAMIEAHLPGIGWNLWLRRADGDWRVVMTTTSTYPD